MHIYPNYFYQTALLFSKIKYILWYRQICIFNEAQTKTAFQIHMGSILLEKKHII